MSDLTGGRMYPTLIPMLGDYLYLYLSRYVKGRLSTIVITYLEEKKWK